MADVILTLKGLEKQFRLTRNTDLRRENVLVRAVDRVDLEVRRGETFGIVGESGCGKSTLSRLILRLLEPSDGEICINGSGFENAAVNKLRGKSLKRYRSLVQMIFQDPYSSLDPRMTLFDIVAEPLRIHGLCSTREDLAQKVSEAFVLVDLPAIPEFTGKLPEEISGGQRQRIGIARAIVTGAKLIIADEPVSMLDATVKAKMVELLDSLKHKLGLTYVFITHEMGIAWQVCDRLGVMYLGQFMETGPSDEVIRNPMHPYTRMLISAVPPLRPQADWGEGLTAWDGSFTPYNGIGCRFAPRCPKVQDICRRQDPGFTRLKDGRLVRCHLPGGSKKAE